MGNRAIERTCFSHGMSPQCEETLACMNVDPTEMQAFDDQAVRASKGAIFDETLIGLSRKDRELLLFCGGSNLAAVRWLFLLGGNLHACDANGTTCLLTAVRTGTIPIIEFLLQHGVDLNCSDMYGWTPLHVSIHMCRRDVVLLLLRMRASLTVHDVSGNTPVDLCTDPHTHRAIQDCLRHRRAKPNEPWMTDDLERNAAVPPSSPSAPSTEQLRYEPNFVPRRPAMFDPDSKEELILLGRGIFNQSPGAGLAFLVASGCVGSYPVEISRFLRQNKVDLAKLGNFLSHPISLTQQLRAEFINSLSMQNTDVLEALRMAFTIMTIPHDLQKVDQLVRSIAAIWWRQHERLLDGRTSVPPSKDGMKGDEKLSGLQLMQYLGGSHCLYQLMFSTVMLHCQVHAPQDLGAENLRMTPKGWSDINKGIEAQGDVPEHVLMQLFRSVLDLEAPIQEILMFKPTVNRAPDGAASMQPLISLSGWVELRCPHGFSGPALAVGNEFSEMLHDMSHTDEKDPGTSPQGAPRPSPPSNPMVLNARPIFDFQPEASVEASFQPTKKPYSHLDKLMTHQKGEDAWSAADVIHALSWATTTQGQVWLSVAGPMLLISTAPENVPFGVIHLPRVEVTKVDAEACRLTLGAKPRMNQVKGLVGWGSENNPRDIILILLLPDGRWQEIGIPTLSITVKEKLDFPDWEHFCRNPKDGCGYSV